MSQVAVVAELARRASPPAVDLARRVLEQDVADASWAAQVGPALSQSDVALLLGKSEQAVSKDSRLLRIRNRDGRPVYPVVQFDGRRQLPGVGEVVGVLSPWLQPLTIASFLTAEQRGLSGRSPVVALRAGEVDDVLVIAGRLAGTAA